MNSERPKRMTQMPETIEKMANEWEVTLSFQSNLPDELKDNLGYEPLSDEYTEWLNNVITEIDLQVLETLKKINILPFDKKAIKKYQQDLIEPHELEYKSFLAKNDFKLKISIILFFTTLIACICGNIWNIPIIKYFGWISFVSIIAVIQYSITSDNTQRFLWCNINLEIYLEKIPLSILNHANEIKKILKDSNFYIQKMQFSIARYNVDETRFLIMIYRKKIYYIDIWDESEFNGKTID